MDALRRAEQLHQSAKSGSAPAPLTLEPLPQKGSSDEAPLPELPGRLEELDAQFLAGGASRPRGGANAAGSREPAASSMTNGAQAAERREAVRNAFAVKAPAPAGRPGFLLGIGAATLVAVIGIGAYFWWQLQPPRGGLAAGPALSSPAAVPAPPPPALAPAAAPPSAGMSTPPTASAVASVTDSATTARASPPAAPTPDTRPPSRPPQPAPTRSAMPLPTAPAASSETPDLVIRPSQPSGRRESPLELAHAAFQRGEYALARAQWQRALQADPRNLDALHGLAALAQREGNGAQALELYRRILAIDPKDAAAFAGMLALAPPTDPRQAESALKQRLSEQPDSPHLHFALGNLYLAEARWAEAQQAFFKAHVADASHPDYLYNLAVSLDHLHQTRLAAQFYARALAAAAMRPAAFNADEVAARLKTLQANAQ